MMQRWLSTLGFLSLIFGLVATSAAAPGAGVSEAETKQVRSVIEAQLKALAVDDAPAAFALAAPQIRERFGSADRFLAMVRGGYPVVYRPASVAFLEPERAEGGAILQAVHLTDASGALWLARYRLERQADKSWRISGCDVAPAEGRVA